MIASQGSSQRERGLETAAFREKDGRKGNRLKGRERY